MLFTTVEKSAIHLMNLQDQHGDLLPRLRHCCIFSIIRGERGWCGEQETNIPLLNVQLSPRKTESLEEKIYQKAGENTVVNLSAFLLLVGERKEKGGESG